MPNKKIYLIILVLPFLDNQLFAQNFIGGGFTLSTYFGDISPYSKKQSWAALHPGAGFYFAKQIKKPFYLEFDFEQSTISGEDASSNDPSRIMRNLSFKSPITSLAVSLGIRVPITKKESFGFSGGLGGAIFKFNPKAELDGIWYRLQPMSTEGQGLPGGPKKYNLTQWAIPIQGGIFGKFNTRLKAELVLTQYFTTTDYLDDLSGNYFDPDILVANRGEIANRLSYRTKEVDPTAPDVVGGSVRGNPKRNDQFVFIKLGVSYSLGNSDKNKSNKAVKCPTF